MKLRFWKDPYILGIFIFGTLNVAMHPLLITCLYSKLSSQTIAAQTLLSSICGLLATYVGQKYRSFFLTRTGFYASCVGDWIIGFICLALYKFNIVGIDTHTIIMSIFSCSIGKVYFVARSYMVMKYYCGVDEEETSNNKSDYDKIINYSTESYCILGAVIGFIVSIYIKNISAFDILLYSNIIFTIIVLTEVIRFEIFRKCL